MIALGLSALLLFAHPGPIDHNGGHIDEMTGQYHLHAGTSYQFRYVDAAGRIWEGNGPRPDENLGIDLNDIFWRTPFVVTLVITGLGAGLLYYVLETWFQRRRRHRHRRRHTG